MILAPKCPFKIITGLNCPACGIQRCIHALLYGHFAEAIHYNYYLIFAGPYAGAFIFGWFLPEGRIKTRLFDFLEQKFLVYTYIVTFLLWLVIRNIYHL